MGLGSGAGSAALGRRGQGAAAAWGQPWAGGCWLHVGEKRPFAPATLIAGSGGGEQAARRGHPATEGALEAEVAGGSWGRASAAGSPRLA